MSQTPLSIFRLAILGLLEQQPMSGYDLLRVFATTAMGHFGSSPGAVYPALKRLEEAGLIRGETEGQDTFRPKRVFQLSPVGKEALVDWLSQPVTHEETMQGVGPIHLRFVFAGNILGQSEAVRILQEFADAMEAYVPDLERQLMVLAQDLSVYGEQALRHGIETQRAEVEWARRVVRILTADSPALSRGLIAEGDSSDVEAY